MTLFRPFHAALVMLSTLAGPALAAGPPADRLGIIVQERTNVCLYTDTRLRPGTPVAVVIPLPPQSSTLAYVANAGVGCAGLNGRAGSRLVPASVLDTATIALGVFGPGVGVTETDGTALVRAGTTALHTVRVCSSDTGVHLTVWQGLPLQGRRAFRGTVVRPRAGEPDCKEQDEAELPVN